ncbi:putative nucleotide-binding alpha-beta plait domain superfamily [Helianthus anomalus]
MRKIVGVSEPDENSKILNLLDPGAEKTNLWTKVAKLAKPRGQKWEVWSHGFGFVTFAKDGVADRVSRTSHEICGKQIALDSATPVDDGGQAEATTIIWTTTNLA